jgi:hypothetical protein
MKLLRLWVTLGIFALLAAVGSVALPHAQSDADRRFIGRSYLVTFKESGGNFVAREVITLHEDRTMSAIDSGQGGPAYYYSSQLGSWKPDGRGRVAARTIDFDFPPSPNVVARLDFTLGFEDDFNQITGTVAINYFPLESDPLGSGGTVIANYSVAGELMRP